jgi:ribosomal protein S18 acetylase RimI-like enzyme
MSMNVCIKTIHDIRELDQIKDDWDSLVFKSSKTPFLFYDIARPFISLNVKNGWNAAIVTVLSNDNELIGIIPLMEKKIYGIRVAKFVLRPAYSPDFIISSEIINKYKWSIIDYVIQHSGCHLFSLDFEASSPWLESLGQRCISSRVPHIITSEMGHRVIPIESNWENLLLSKGASFRRKFRVIERNLGRIGAWKITCFNKDQTNADILDAILEVERESWKESWRAKKGSKVDDSLIAIWEGLNRTAQTRSDLDWGVWFLEINDHPVAYALIAIYSGVASIIKTSYNARYRRFYPGIYVINIAMSQLWDTRKIKMIDFLTDLQFMDMWTNEVEARYKIFVSKNSFLPLPLGFLLWGLQNGRDRKHFYSLATRMFESMPRQISINTGHFNMILPAKVKQTKLGFPESGQEKQNLGRNMDVTIRRFQKDDIKASIRMNQSIGSPRRWLSRHRLNSLLLLLRSKLLHPGPGNFERDANRMMDYEPEGCFIAEIGRLATGYVFSVSYGKLGTIGMLRVGYKYRGKGIGTLLMRRAINYLSERGVEQITLDSNKDAYDLYKKLGFNHECNSLRYEVKAHKLSEQTPFQVEHIGKSQITQIIEFDSKFFGANRRKVLLQMYEDAPELSFWVGGKSGVLGYLLCQSRSDGYRVGPWVCDPKDPQVARALLSTIINSVNSNKKLCVSVLDTNIQAIQLLETYGFKKRSKSYRMYLGKKVYNDMANGIFGIGGPEKG